MLATMSPLQLPMMWSCQMPDVSQKQRRAMFAAKEGRSTLGIPKKVGAEFIAADKKAGKFQGHKGRMESLRGRAKTSMEK
jgi:hypothetical protein